MDIANLFAEHQRRLQQNTAEILQGLSYEGLVISSGSPFVYFADDHDAPFQPTPHFAHWCPDEGPHHLLHFKPGCRPRLIRYAPADFWYEHAALVANYWSSQFDIVEVGHKQELTKVLGNLQRHAFIGPEAEWAKEQGLDANPPDLVAPLDWERGVKSAYELHCMDQANEIAAHGHRAARAAFAGGASEIEIHHAYVEALGCTDAALPYNNIVALDAKSAVLHYQNKRRDVNGGVLLIDAGARYRYYASDITRTYAKKEVSETFRALLQAMEQMQQELCKEVKVGVEYVHLHDQSHQRLAGILSDHGLLKGCSVDEAIAKGLTRAFFPHGLGHMLGIQVHDVAGKQKNAAGDACPPSSKYPTLRTVRHLRENEVITMEPGLYFIPILLEPLRAQSEGRLLNFTLIDELTKWGGIRIEDNIVVGENGQRNLTRQHLGNDLFC